MSGKVPPSSRAGLSRRASGAAEMSKPSYFRFCFYIEQSELFSMRVSLPAAYKVGGLSFSLFGFVFMLCFNWRPIVWHRSV